MSEPKVSKRVATPKRGSFFSRDRPPLPVVPLTLTTPQRLSRLADSLFRNSVPIYGLLFLHYDAQRMMLLYFFDTWIGLIMVAALDVRLTQRSANAGVGNGRSLIANYFDAVVSSILVISVLMIPVAAPALFMSFSEGKSLLAKDSTLWPLVGANAAVAAISFLLQSVTMPNNSATEAQFRHRFQLTFFRWLAVVVIFYGLLQFIGFSTISIYLMVIVYSGFSVFGDCFPEQIERIPEFLKNMNKWSR